MSKHHNVCYRHHSAYYTLQKVIKFTAFILSYQDKIQQCKEIVVSYHNWSLKVVLQGIVFLIVKLLEIEALTGLLRVAPAAMVASVGSISVLFSFSSSDISASNCNASHCSKYQDGGWEALLLERITAGCNRPLDRQLLSSSRAHLLFYKLFVKTYDIRSFDKF